ncbi:hypothetical protein PSI9734_01516 [Pseudidiomarina piscicola]|uniref:DUF2982 domain-containing protein n=1 Tax=Pseudidiomarina piscicola TaxID=2614830 RepID=A0A6S6WM34_9GAMM|nr:DUF2982 domain-containing protein [Pseudidiomarina piscicola]CAB0151101.1 hypothetical protein PSI9734_01516 [Pseudidiomarina piscicola]VZT40609.1 hypothetical protein PSI9734_01516 [Pseudomonas aeruginosa]
MTDPELTVEPTARRDALTFCVFGVLVFAVTLFFYLAGFELPQAAWGLMYIASAALFFLGIAKLVEPQVSLVLSPTEVRYEHRRGTWHFNWDNLIRFDIPRTQRGGEVEELPYIGFRLNNIEPVLDSISPRLAVYLVSEQRHLLAAALRRELPAGTDYTPYYDIPSYYKSANGQVYRGVQALFAVRCQQLRELLGYDLYVPSSALDRPLDEFCRWLQQVQQHRHQVDPE